MTLEKKKKIIKKNDVYKHIKLAKKGNEDSFEYLLNIVKHEFETVQNNLFVLGNEKSDNDQECAMMLIKAIEKFNPEKCEKIENNEVKNFRYYVRLLCRGRLISLIQASQRHKSKIIDECESIDVTYKDKEGNEYSMYDFIQADEELLSDKIIKKQYVNFLREKINKHLTKLEKDVMEFHFENYSYSEIASILNIDSKSVDNAIQRAKHKMPLVRKELQESNELDFNFGIKKTIKEEK